MNAHLSDPTAPRTPHQPTDDALRKASDIAAAVDAIYHGPTFYKDPTTPPAIGSAPPVPQPGRPPMSAAATNASGVLIASSVPILALGAAATGILWGSGHADPGVIAWVCAGVVAAPAAITAPILALKGLMKSAKQAAEAAPPVIHQHYSGTIVQDQRSIHTDIRGIVVTNRNALPK